MHALTQIITTRIASYRIRSDDKMQSIDSFFKSINPHVLCLLESALPNYKSFKVNFELFVLYVKNDNGGEC